MVCFQPALDCIGCRGEPFRWEKASRVNTFYWPSLRKASPWTRRTLGCHRECIKSWDTTCGKMPEHVISAKRRLGDRCLCLKQLTNISHRFICYPSSKHYFLTVVARSVCTTIQRTCERFPCLRELRIGGTHPRRGWLSC